MIDEELVMFLFNPILSTKNNVSKTKKICAFVLLVLFSVCFFACSNLYESTETVNLSFDLPHSRSDTNNDRILKVYLHDKNGIILQQRETVFSTETVNVEFSKVLVNSEIYVSVELYNDNDLQLTGKSELTKIKPGKNVIKLTLEIIENETEGDNNSGSETETPETGGNTGSESGGETGGSTDGNETEEPEYTPENAATKIASLTINGHYDIEIEGQFSNIEKLTDIANAINKNENITSVSLDLSNAELSGVPNDTFKDCIKLKTIILPDNKDNGYGTSYGGVKSINQNAFAGCTSLTSITLPASLNGIYMGAFDGCTSLTTIHFNGTEEKWNTLNGEDSGIDENININYLTSYPVLAKDAPSIIQSYSNNANYILVIVGVCTEDQLKNIVEAMNCIQISGTTVSLDLYGTTGLTEIPDNCFENCTRLAKIILPEGITSIGANAFSGCVELFSIYFPTTLKKIGENAFTNCHEDLYYNAKYGGESWNSVEGGDSFIPYVNRKPY